MSVLVQKIFRLFSSASQRYADYVHGLPNLDIKELDKIELVRINQGDCHKFSVVH